MKLYKVTLLANERAGLEAITQKGSPPSQKVINALILLNCDEGEFNDHRSRGEDVNVRKQWVGTPEPLALTRQCELIGVARSTVYAPHLAARPFDRELTLPGLTKNRGKLGHDQVAMLCLQLQSAGESPSSTTIFSP